MCRSSDGPWIDRVQRTIHKTFDALGSQEFETVGDQPTVRVDAFLTYYPDRPTFPSIPLGLHFGRVTTASQPIRVTAHYIAEDLQNASEQDLFKRIAADIEFILRRLQEKRHIGQRKGCTGDEPDS